MSGFGRLGVGAVVGGLVGRYLVGRREVERRAHPELDVRLADLGEVERVSILPLVERYTARAGLRGEPGVSYLIEADESRLLFDTGLGGGSTAEGVAAFDANVTALGQSLDALDGVVISHLHLDHVGGARSQLRRTFAAGRRQVLPRKVPAYVPTPMTHDRADVCVVDRARVICPGVAVLPPLPRMLFWMGPIAEQAMVINVRGHGLVVVTGCGHPRIERVLAAVERVVDRPIHAVIGGLHLPVHPLGTPLLPQAVLGNPNWPWRPINEDDARAVIDVVRHRGPGLVALSGHDSTEWTLRAFRDAFGDRYRTLRVGEEITIGT